MRSSLVVLALWLVSASARADAIDPSVAACGEPGDACTLDGQPGACYATTCSRLSYGSPGSGGPAPSGPTTVKYECAKCLPGARPAGAASEPSTESSKGSSCAVGSTSTTLASLVLGLGLLGLATRRQPKTSTRTRP